MQCPTCNVTLVMTDRQGIEIDYCPQCRGVWLDRGELDKIIERSTQEVPPVQPAARPVGNAGYGDQRHYGGGQYHGKYKKKKGLLGELFDF
jgi:Zn-finger nucleic acid-binding protein